MAIDNHGFDPGKNVYNLTDILNRIQALEDGAALSYDSIYPVGSIYITTNTTDPKNLFPGTTWERYGKGRTLVSLDEGDTDFNSVNKAGGVKVRNYTPQGTTDDFTLTELNMPSHRHRIGNHYHCFQYSGAAGASDRNVYTDFIENPVGVYSVNIWAPDTSPKSGQVETGTLQKRYVASNAQVGNRLRTGYPEDNSESEYLTNATGGGLPHKHSFRAGNISLNTLQPYITCYIWRRKA